ncbi:MAG: type II secretion system F family protein [Candidatus Eremiobacteraeota bacterium]|nr:type II secretion system F family protein [Candidatus Eremiobacteraeota bacterium]
MLHLSLKDQISFFTQMATMLKAGVPIVKSLETIGTNALSRGQRRFALAMADFVAKGGRLSDGLSELPGIRDDFVIAMVRVGETGGFLDQKLRELAFFLEKVQAFRMSFMSSMIYPLLIFHGSVLLPPLFYLFTGEASTYFRVILTVLVPFYALVASLAVLHTVLASSRAFRSFCDSVFVFTPLVGGVIKKFAVARFARAFANLYESGINVNQCVTAASSACGNMLLAGRFRKIAPAIDRGTPLSQAFRQSGLFPPLALQLIATGEETGTMATMLLKSADILDEQLDHTMKRFFVILPVLVLLMAGGYVGYVVIRQYMKIFDMFYRIR